MGDKQSRYTTAAEGSGQKDVEGGGAALKDTASSGQEQVNASLATTGASNQAVVTSVEAVEEIVVPSESEILARLVTNLGQCPSQSLPLAEILDRLPPQLRKLAGDTEGVCRWLQGFPGLLEVSGPAGEENVQLTVGKLPLLSAARAAAPEAPKALPAPAPAARAVGPVPAGYVGGGASEAARPGLEGGAGDLGAKAASVNGTNGIVGDDEGFNPSSVQLRGLPFRSTIADIRNFLGEHIANLSPMKDNIRLLLNRDGRPSGFARIFFNSPQAAHLCRDGLHRKQLGDRYIEVLACNDRAGKARARKTAEIESAGQSAAAAAPVALDGASEQFEKERILHECRQHLSIPGHQQILLSMLGIALSDPARNYLRRANLGLKHFLARFPNEFRVEGPKGCEKIIWMPAGMVVGAEMATVFEENAARQIAWREPSTPQRERVPMPLLSPNEKLFASVHSHHGMATPSDWGTPGPHQAAEALLNGLNVGANTGALDFSAFQAAGWPPFAAGWPAPPWVGGAEGPWGNSMMWGDVPGAHAGMAGISAAGGAAKAPAKKTSAPKDGAAAAAPSARSHAHLHPQSHPFAGRPGGDEAKDVREVVVPQAKVLEDDGVEVPRTGGLPALRLRGLPFSVTVQDVLAFFAQHDVADLIHDGKDAAQLLPKANGRPSGQAVVQMRSRGDAEAAQRALCNQWVGSRYIEVFVYGGEGDEGDELGQHKGLADARSNGGPPLTAGGMPMPPLTVGGMAGPPGWPGWTNSFSGAAPWAMPPVPPWTGLIPPPVPGVGPLPPLLSHLVPGPAGEAGQADNAWEAIFQFMPGGMPGMPGGMPGMPGGIPGMGAHVPGTLPPAPVDAPARPTLQV
eukprot:CAMPEP_0115078200 /NCGR_PEP_ID=MMETSP0227-20121206/17425_1 /TAXON_ID=89957 /ORGANISM="Polarella glacialis, Strain CCMP 1383" /LENGTH=854 /DNA_ID=CAMNT_0002465575 /DNA_START=75 /DNA_END=2639 /DNA_ORIENTATION=+